MENYTWIIINSTYDDDGDASGPYVRRFDGSEDEVKMKLLSFLKEERETDAEHWCSNLDRDAGSVEELTVETDSGQYRIHGGSTFDAWVSEYVAIRLDTIKAEW